MQPRIRIKSRDVLVAAAALTCMLGWPVATAHADDKQRCLEAYDKAQTVRQADQLVEAQDKLLVCARDECPAIVRQDCTQWLAEVEQAIPTVVVVARGPDGSDAIDVTVTADGKPFAERLDGKAVRMNPGVHTFRFEMEGAKPVEERVVIHAGAKNREISVQFQPIPSVPDEGESKRSPAQDTGAEASPTPAYVLGGVGLVGLAGFTYFGLRFDSKLDDMDQCSPNCPQEDADSASNTRLIALISGGVGIVSLGVATYLFLSPGDPSAQVGSAPRVDVVPMNGGAVGVVGGRF